VKISITGTHSSGKTTLAKLCSEKLGLKYVRGDTMRETMRKYFPGKTFETLTAREHWDLEVIGLKERISAEMLFSNYVSDGCTLNSIAYANAFLGKKILEMPDVDDFLEMATSNAKNYDVIFYLPPEIPLECDGFRPIDRDFRLHVDKLLINTSEKYNFVQIKGTIEERIDSIEKFIKNKKIEFC